MLNSNTLQGAGWGTWVVCCTFINLRFEINFILYIHMHIYFYKTFVCGDESILDGIVDKGLMHGWFNSMGTHMGCLYMYCFFEFSSFCSNLFCQWDFFIFFVDYKMENLSHVGSYWKEVQFQFSYYIIRLLQKENNICYQGDNHGPLFWTYQQPSSKNMRTHPPWSIHPPRSIPGSTWKNRLSR